MPIEVSEYEKTESETEIKMTMSERMKYSFETFYRHDVLKMEERTKVT